MNFSDAKLATPRLLLRPFCESDAEALYAIFCDAVVTRYWSRAAWTEFQQARDRIARDIANMASRGYPRFALERREDAAMIGECCLVSISDQCRRAEVGYALARSAWRQGYMDEALRALLGLAFGPMNLNRIEADVDPRNRASERCLERLGFQREGTLRERWIVSGEVSDSALYGLLAREWTP